MRIKEAQKRFKELDRQNRRVFTSGDMRKFYPQDSDKAIADGISRLMASGDLERPAKGIYVYANTIHPRTHLVYEVARALRRGFHTYLSMESALSEYGAISQVPSGHITFMTTGRRGEFKTPYGNIEFTHTKRDPADFVADLRDNDRPLPIASCERAYVDLKRVGRNLHLVQMDEVEEEIARAKTMEITDAEFC